jgi:hypothetical protein
LRVQSVIVGWEGCVVLAVVGTSVVTRARTSIALDLHFVKYYRSSRDFLPISTVENSQPRRYERTRVATGIAVGMVVVVALERVIGRALVGSVSHDPHLVLTQIYLLTMAALGVHALPFAVAMALAASTARDRCGCGAARSGDLAVLMEDQ